MMALTRLATNWDGLPGTALRILILTGIFLSGAIEAKVLKLKFAPCATWLIGLGGLTAWIASPGTRFVLGWEESCSYSDWVC
jgi:hypothetical protein